MAFAILDRAALGARQPRRRAASLCVALAFACLTFGGAAAQDLTIRFASLYPPAHSASRTADRFAELVAEKTDGAIVVDVFHNSALGSEREAAEGVKSGSIDAAYSGLPGFGSYVPEFGVLELPFNYESLDDVKRVVDEISATLEERMASQGLILLGYLYDGPRVTISTRPLNSLADFDGLKFRVPQAPLYVQMAEAFGASPTPVSLPEVYTALQSNIVEALEGTPTSLYANKYHEIAKNIARTDHIFFVAYIAMNADLFNSLPAEQQAALREAGQEASAFNLEIAKEAVQADFARLQEAGVTFTEPDREPFEAAVADMKASFVEDLGPAAAEIYEKIQAVSGDH